MYTSTHMNVLVKLARQGRQSEGGTARVVDRGHARGCAELLAASEGPAHHHPLTGATTEMTGALTKYLLSALISAL